MDLKNLPLIDGDLPTDPEHPNKRYVVLMAKNGKGPVVQLLRLRPHDEPSDLTRFHMQEAHKGITFVVGAAGRIERLGPDHYKMHRGTEVYCPAIEGANLLRTQKHLRVETASYEGGGEVLLKPPQPEAHAAE